LTQQDDLRAVIATGLMAGEQIVTTGFARIAEATLVQVTNAEEAGQIPTGGRPDRPRGGRGTRGGGETGKATQPSGGKASTPP
jgi:membrane fusion protein, multidrug efflux system